MSAPAKGGPIGFTCAGWDYLRNLGAVASAIEDEDRHAEERAFDALERTYPELTNDDREILRAIGHPVGNP